MKRNPRHSPAARTETVTARIDKTTLAALDKAAKQMKIPRGRLIAETLAVAMGENRTCALS